MNSLKSIYSRITTMSEAETILNSVGVSIRNMSGEVLGVNDILSTLSGKWSSLTNEQRQNIGVTVAGRFQLNRFLALMSNWDIALASTETALNSQGSAIEENSKYLQSLEARINRMKSGWEQLSLAFGEAVITDTLITLISVGTSLAGLFTKITESVGVLPVLFGTVAFATFALSTSFRLLITSTTQAVAGLLGIPLATTSASTGVWSLSAALKALNFSIKGLLASTGIGLVFVGIGFAAEFLMKKLGDANREVDDSIDSLTSLGDKVSEITHLNELADEYGELAKKVSLSTEEKVRLSSIESDLQTKYSLSLAALGEEGKGYESNNQLIKQKITLLQEELRLKNESASRDFRSNETALNDDAKKSKVETDALAESLKKAKDAQEKFIQARETGGAIDNSKGQFLDSDFLKFKFDPEDNNYAEWIQAMGERISAAVDEAQGKFDESNNKYQQSINSISQALNGEFQNYLDVLEGSGKKVKTTTRNLFDALASLSAESGNTRFATDDLDKIFKIFNTSTIKNVEDAKRAFNSLPIPLELTSEQLSAIDLALKKAEFGTYSDGTEMALEGTENLTSSQEEMTKKMDETISSLSSLSSAYETLSEGEQLSADTLVELIDNYPELASYLAQTNDLTFDKGEIIKKVAELDRQARIEEFQRSLDAVEVTRDELTQKQNLYKEFFQKLLDASPNSSQIPFMLQIGREEQKELDAANAQADNLKAKISALSQPLSFYSGSSKSSSKKDKSKSDKNKDEAKLQDATQATINLINKQSLAQEESNKELERKADVYESEKDYQNAILYTTKLLNGQTQEIKDLQSANSQLTSKRKSLDGTTSYDLSSFVDENGEANETYFAKFNKLTTGSSQDALQKMFDQYSQLYKAELENDKKINALGIERNSTVKRLEDDRLANTQAYLDKRNKSFENYDKQLEHSKNVQSLYEEGSKEWRKEQENQLKILEEIKDARHADSESIRKKLKDNEKAKKSEKLTTEQIALLNAQLDANSSAWFEASRGIKDNTDSLKDLQKEWEDNVKDATKDAMGAIEDYYEKQGELAQESLDKQLDAYEDYIDGRKKLLSRDNEEEDFTKTRDNLQKEELKLLEKLNIAKLDDSTDNKLKIEELEKELSDKVEEINELNLQRNRKLREDNLDDLVENKQKEIEVSKSAAEKKWQADLAVDATYSALREALLTNNITNMQTALSGFKDAVTGYMEIIGKSIDMNLIEKLDMQNGFNGVQDKIDKIGEDPNTTYNREKSAAWSQYLSNKKEAEAMGSNKGTAYQELKSDNDALRTKWGFENKSYDELKDKVMTAKSGGMTPSFSGGKFLLAHEKELVLSKMDTANILKAVDITRNFMSNIKMPNFSGFTPATVGAGSGDIHYHLDVRIDKLGTDQNGANQFFSKIQKGLDKLGKK